MVRREDTLLAAHLNTLAHRAGCRSTLTYSLDLYSVLQNQPVPLSAGLWSGSGQ